MSDSAQDDASQGSAAATAEAAEVPGTAQAPEPGAAPENGDMPDLDDVKRHFREALDRKNKANSKDTAATDGKDKGKAQVAHGPASARRSFRRKSG